MRPTSSRADDHLVGAGREVAALDDPSSSLRSVEGRRLHAAQRHVRHAAADLERAARRGRPPSTPSGCRSRPTSISGTHLISFSAAIAAEHAVALVRRARAQEHGDVVAAAGRVNSVLKPCCSASTPETHRDRRADAERPSAASRSPDEQAAQVVGEGDEHGSLTAAQRLDAAQAARAARPGRCPRAARSRACTTAGEQRTSPGVIA